MTTNAKLRIIALPAMAVIVVSVAIVAALRRSRIPAENPHPSSLLQSPTASTGLNSRQDHGGGAKGQVTDSAPPEKQSKSPGTLPDRYHIDLRVLRRAVLNGDVHGVEDIGGNLEAEDAETFYELLFQVPADMAKEDRDRVLSVLAVKLQQTRGDLAARLLFDAVLRDGLIPESQWYVCVHVLGQKRYKGAQPFLEDLAFSRNGTDKIFSSGCALLLIAPESTLYRLKEGIRFAPDQRLSSYVQVLRQANSLSSYYPDITPVILTLKDRLRGRAALSDYNRMGIATLLTDYARRKDPDLKGWLKIELQNAIASTEGNSEEEAEKYRGLLKSLE
ncbi:MAG TPA: hypothetical protein VK661_03725 [Planctomycetota bacterium]|nr:hypothetical protein [Planctomycetota bacterium]